jgi:hypothetical protein
MRGSPSETAESAWAPSEAESIALAYYRAHRRDGWAALVHAIEDALADLDAADAAIRERGRQVSLGYVRGGPPT